MKKENSFAIFEYEKCDEDLIDLLSNYLEENAHFALDFFEVEQGKDKVLIKIIPTKKEFDDYYIKTHDLPPETILYGWLIGTYNWKRNEIDYLSLHDFKNTEHKLKNVPFDEAIDYYQKTIFHEFVHYANGLFRNKHNCYYSEKYLTEGIAAYLSGQHDKSKCKFNFTVDSVLNPNNNNYPAYFLLTKYFVKNYDKKFVLEMFESSRKAREFLKQELYDRAKADFLAFETEKQ